MGWIVNIWFAAVVTALLYVTTITMDAKENISNTFATIVAKVSEWLSAVENYIFGTKASEVQKPE